MSRTVDLVIAGEDAEALAAAVDALERGLRVLVVVPAGDEGASRRLHRRLSHATTCGQLSVIANAEVVCVDGAGRVEAVVIRDRRTGRLCGVNASAFLVGNRGRLTPEDGSRLV